MKAYGLQPTGIPNRWLIHDEHNDHLLSPRAVFARESKHLVNCPMPAKPWTIIDEINNRLYKHAQKVERAAAVMRAAIARGVAKHRLPIRDAARTV